jgi:hypothetical protein
MITIMKNTRKIVIKSLMAKAVNENHDVNEVLRAIKAFDLEAFKAFETVARYQEMCCHYSEAGPITIFESIVERIKNERL